jgi:hypothetical protein
VAAAQQNVEKRRREALTGRPDDKDVATGGFVSVR